MVEGNRGISLAVVGLGFGRSFVPIYQAHPDVSRVAICDTNERLLAEVGDRFAIQDRFASLDAVIADGTYDAVHLLTPVPFHVDQSLAALGAGLHCACAVPMATEIEGLKRIVQARRAANRTYMMMETAAFSREFFYVRDLYERGELGTITFMRGAHIQDLEGLFPLYWRAQPPMHYATHAIAPLLRLMNTRATRVCCLGAGKLREDLQQPGGNRFPLQTAIFQLEGSDAIAEVTRCWFQTARSFVESFHVYGDRASFEWPLLSGEDPVFSAFDASEPQYGRGVTSTRVKIPYRPDLLPPQLAPFVESDHGGSHPHLVHEFVSSVVEGRPSAIDVEVAADWTAAGICANQSSLRRGEPVELPSFK